jgi:hypothetical protein
MPAGSHAVLRVALLTASITPGVAGEIHTHADSQVIVGTVTFFIAVASIPPCPHGCRQEQAHSSHTAESRNQAFIS